MSQIISISPKTIFDCLDKDERCSFNMDPIVEIDESNTAVYEDTIDENEQMLKEKMPNKILFSIEETASVLGVSYDYVRNLANTERIASKQFGKRKMIHIKELSRIITEGVN